MTRDTPSDDAPRRARHDDKDGDFAVVGRSVLINRAREDLYAFWRDFQNLPQFMQAIESIRPTGPNKALWTVKTPAGHTVEFESEIVAEEPNTSISWRSVEGSQLETRGTVSFSDAPAGRGTIVTANIAYVSPAGDLGRLVAKLFATEPNIQARHELKRFKMLMEAGEIAVSAHYRDSGENN